MPFRDNGNSMASCFQYLGPSSSLDLTMRIKIYWKTLALLQSDGVLKQLGMNTRALFYPSIRMGQALTESRDAGLTRIEITYTADTRAKENWLLHRLFPPEAKQHISKVAQALSRVKGISWRLPLTKLLDTFTEKTRAHQLLVVQPNSAALIYASNQKSGCFTGFFQPGPARQSFDFLSFLKIHALPGPASITHCLLQHHGPTGPTSFFTIVKEAPLA